MKPYYVFYTSDRHELVEIRYITAGGMHCFCDGDYEFSEVRPERYKEVVANHRSHSWRELK